MFLFVRWNSHINISLCVNIYLLCSFHIIGKSKNRYAIYKGKKHLIIVTTNKSCVVCCYIQFTNKLAIFALEKNQTIDEIIKLVFIITNEIFRE